MAKRAVAQQPVSTVQEFDCIQGSDTWHALRCGIPTASEFGKIMANSEDKIGRAQLMKRLAGEIITGEPDTSFFKSAAMDRGNAMEPEARRAYALTHGVEVRQVGFVRNGKYGASPDGLIVGARRGLEIKTASPSVLIDLLEKKKARKPPPNTHKAQIQGVMMVCDLDEVDLTTFWPKMPECVWRFEREPGYIAELKERLDYFEYELRQMTKSLREMMA